MARSLNGKANGGGRGGNSSPSRRSPLKGSGQVVLVFQGGGALGAFQAGVYQALQESGVEPDWVVGTSIGAINASLIAGNPPPRRLDALNTFWTRMSDKAWWQRHRPYPDLSQTSSFMKTIAFGIPGFFEPRPMAFLGPHVPLGPDHAGYYSTGPLERTLNELVDFSRLTQCTPRITVGAAHVRTSEMHYFDSREITLDVKHILASGALPPAFPPVRIDGELYWDGGILSNTPTEAIFDDFPRRSSLIFAVHMWNPEGPEPRTLWEVAHRQKDIQYSSRVATHIRRQQEAHQLRHAISQLTALLPAQVRQRAEVRGLAGFGCLTRMHVVRLLAPRLANEDQTKDIDFSPAGIRERWTAGYQATVRAIKRAPWLDPIDPSEGVILHEIAKLEEAAARRRLRGRRQPARPGDGGRKSNVVAAARHGSG